MRDNFDPAGSWPEIESIRNKWKGQLIIKGVLDP